MNIQLFNTKQKKLLWMSIPIILFAMLSIYLLSTHKAYLRVLPCPILEYFGVPCPGCGATRATSSLARFDIVSAVKYNLGIVILYVYLGVLYCVCAYKIIRYNTIISIKLSNIIGIIVFLILWEIIRTMSFYPFPIDNP